MKPYRFRCQKNRFDWQRFASDGAKIFRNLQIFLATEPNLQKSADLLAMEQNSLPTSPFPWQRNQIARNLKISLASEEISLRRKRARLVS
jgi:hypothetical protein